MVERESWESDVVEKYIVKNRTRVHSFLEPSISRDFQILLEIKIIRFRPFKFKGQLVNVFMKSKNSKL